MGHTHEYWACVDCYQAYHYGVDDDNIPTDWDVDTFCETLALIGENNIADDTDAETGDGIREFSRTSCDMCFSGLAGNRFRMAVWKGHARS